MKINNFCEFIFYSLYPLSIYNIYGQLWTTNVNSTFFENKS